MIKKYRKKPVVIEAIEFTGDANFKSLLQNWTDGACKTWDAEINLHSLVYDDFLGASHTKIYNLSIPTLEGPMTASIGDYIIKGVNGEFYPCKPDIFKKTYEEIDR